MPTEKNKILKFNQYMKLDKIPYIIYADLESLMIILQQQKKVSIFPVDIQCQQVGDLII